jgi:hypothetical protein
MVNKIIKKAQFELESFSLSSGIVLVELQEIAR